MKRLNLIKWLFYIFLGVICWKSKAQDPNFHIYLCFGQSNMEGAGPIENQDRTGVDARFQVMGAVNCSQNGKIYAIGKWQTATPSLVRCNTGLGPSDYFGRTMVSNLPGNIKIGVVPVAIGGCDIALFDKVNYGAYVATAPSWMIGTINSYGGNPYARLVEVAKLAQKDGVIKGILLHQGETNNGQQTWPAKVKAIYDNLIKDLGLDPSKTPLLAGELVTTAQGGACGLHNSVIAKLPSTIANAHVVSASGLTQQGDGLHFTSAAYRILGQRYAEKMLSLYPKGNAPSVTLTAPSTNSTFTTLQSITITATATDSDGNISKVDFYDGSILIGTDNTAPYSFAWSGATVGSHIVTAKATDNAGLNSSSTGITVIVQADQAPYKGSPFQVPGRIEAEAYDLGGEGVSFHEVNTNGNEGGANLRNDQVDIEANTDGGGGHNIAYILQNEWLEYTLNVTETSSYILDARVAADGEGKSFHIEIDGVNVTGPIAVSNTGGWQTWATVTLPSIQLYKGQHVMRIAFDASYMNLNYVEFKGIVTEVADMEASDIKLYPNPFVGSILVSSKGAFQYHVRDVFGVIVESGNGYDNTKVGSLLSTGSYVLHIEDDKGVNTMRKIVKQ